MILCFLALEGIVFLEKMMITREKQPDQPKDLRSSASNGAPASTTTKGTGRRIVALVAAMRPKQWTKNLALFVGIIFAQRLLSFSSFERAFVAFVAFCLALSCDYPDVVVPGVEQAATRTGTAAGTGE